MLLRSSSVILVCCSVFFSIHSYTQNKPSNGAPARPRLVVGIVVDQMRWDYLYRFSSRFTNNGFKRMMREGMSCENTMIPYAQTVTAAGHTCAYTGSVPAIHGIMGNEWFDRKQGREVYCVEDRSVKLVGVPSGEAMSPANLWTTTICDELRMATNFQSKVIGIAIKDRGGILPAGHSANAAYWYEGVSGKWISSTYYMEQLPRWVDRFNERKWVDSLYRQDWTTLFPIETYVQSDPDEVSYEGNLPGERAPVFPHVMRPRIGKDYGYVRATPFGDELTLKFSKEALKAEELGKDDITDFLAVSLSSPDYVGHTFGPNSIEVEDTYLRLDRELADFFSFLDKEVGTGRYTVFLTADHAVAQVPGFLKAAKIPAQALAGPLAGLNKMLEETLRLRNVIVSTANYQLYINEDSVVRAGVTLSAVKEACLRYLNAQSEVLTAFDCSQIAVANLPALLRERYINGYNVKRGGDIQVVLRTGYFYGNSTGTTHGTPFPYDAHIPLLWMGWGIRQGQLFREVYMTDIAVTLAALLHIQMPSGATGRVIPEAIK